MIKNLFVLLFITSSAYGQLVQTARYEQEVKRTEDGFTIIPADTMGMFLFQETNDFEGREREWKLIYLDNDLLKQREDLLLIPDKYSWIGHEFTDEHLYLLFRQGDYNKSDLHVIRINIQNGSIDRFDIDNEIDFNITLFSVCKNAAVMGGYVDDRPTLILYDFESEKIKALPGFYLKDAQLMDITVNVNNSFNVLIYSEKNSAERTLDLRVFDSQGNILADDSFMVPEDKEILSGLTSRLQNESLVVTGTFGGNNSKLTEGIYWGRADLSKKQTLKLIPYVHFNSIYDHLSERRRENLKGKIEKRLQNDKFFEKEHAFLYRIVEEKGKFYIMFEIFDPFTVRSHQVAAPYSIDPRYTPYNFSRYYSRLPYGPNVEEYANVRYQQAIVAALKDDGELIWDQALVFERVETDQLQQIAEIVVENARVAIAYKKEDELKWKLIDSEETSPADTSVNIMMSNTSDILKNESEEEGGIQNWTKGTMFIWGYQSLKRRMEEGNNDRLYVFYVNKMEMAE